MASIGYCFISAYLKGEESRLVTSQHVDRVLRASAVQEVIASIDGTDLGDYLVRLPGKTYEELDDELWAYLRGCVEYLEWLKFCPEELRTILRAYLVKYDVSNVKAALRGVLMERKAPMVPFGVLLARGLLDRLSGAEDLDGIIEVLERGGLAEYATVLKDRRTALNGALQGRLEAEAALDRCYYDSLRRVTRGVADASWFAKVLGIMVDLVNLHVVFRAIIEGIGAEALSCGITGGYMIPGEAVGELAGLSLRELPGRLEHTPYRAVAEEVSREYELEGRIGVVEEIVEKHKFRLLREILAPRVLSSLVAIWYLILKELEVRSVRIALKAAADGLPLEEVRNNLVVL